MTVDIPKIRIGIFERIKRELVEAYKVVTLKNEISSHLPANVDSAALFNRLEMIHKSLPCAHNPSHALEFIRDMFMASRQLEGCFVEAGCFKGGSTAKFSVVAKLLNKRLFIFDSFEGLPDHEEPHEKSLEGHSIREWFYEGAFSGSLEEVKNNITKYGEIDVCTFVPGWFSQTMPSFNEAVLAAFIDVDLASSTECCIRNLYPKLVPSGILCSQDGDFPLVVEVFKNKQLWNDLGVTEPEIIDLGQKITRIRKN